MELIFLGTGSATPTFERNVSALAVRREKEVLLFDCGEATQHQIQRAQMRRSRLSKIFITHLHGDHFYGLIGLLTSLQLNKHSTPMELYGPPGLREYIDLMKRISETNFTYPLTITELTPGSTPETVCVTPEYHIEAVRVRHRIMTIAYSLVEKDKPGALDGEMAESLGVPHGPERRRLKEGEDVTLADGTVVRSRELVSPPIPGRKLALITDTSYCKASVALAQSADLLIHESTYDNTDRDNAKRTLHSTVGDAVRVAREADAGFLILTHISSRYLRNSKIIENQVQEAFPRSYVARDMLTVTIPPTGDPTFVTHKQQRQQDRNNK